MYILGISESHCSSACLVKDGRVIAAVSEERLTRVKNIGGFPKNSINFVTSYAGISPNDVDLIVLSFLNPILHYHCLDFERGQLSATTGFLDKIYKIADFMQYKIPSSTSAFTSLYKNFYKPLFYPRMERNATQDIATKLKIDSRKIVRTDHHLCHAYAAYFSQSTRSKPTLVMTHDAEGDSTCSSVNVAEDGKMRTIATTPNYSSLARIYADVTRYLGMKPGEHEYKVMGLAPYADQVGVGRTLPLFSDLVWVGDDLSFHSKFSSNTFYKHLERRLEMHRFDWIAGALQSFLEQQLTQWVRKAIGRTGVRRLTLGGGVFMNVKANMLITELPEVEDIFACPSAGDESTAFGAAFVGCDILGENTVEPLPNLYLGPEYSDDQIKDTINRTRCNRKYKVEKIGDIEGEIASLISAGKIVARFSERMEWGARALGNRSILADPSNQDIVRELNSQIKMRDFWMPFAPTILAERQPDYIVNPKKIASPHMMIGFRTTELGKKELKAAMHPYDFTVRPQILEKNHNEAYYRLIKNFEALTGIGAVLNTSFNLHGDPIVCSPDDAIYTFENSGLRYLAIGNYLISKS